MKIVWNKKIFADSPWEPEFHGVFSYSQSEMRFYYRDGNTVKYVCNCTDEPCILLSPTNQTKLPLPRYWAIIKSNRDAFLLCGENAAISLNSGSQMDCVPDDLRKKYLLQCADPKHFVYDSFRFGEFAIYHKGEWGYSCKKNGSEIWSFSGHGYLYTEIWNAFGNIYFGTAGAGGYFYILDIATGVPVLARKQEEQLP